MVEDDPVGVAALDHFGELVEREIAHGDRLVFGDIYDGAPVRMTGGRHAPFFNTPELFNEHFVRFASGCFGSPTCVPGGKRH
ncbi:hypothetical protein [Roseitalea porphyridii]|uniref:hypothetical protein n=1 Tax=Roseitalea porphyridii TaxID=1852022 RepID=UPI0032EC60CD